jgi:membrane-associated phospholipid phosphatase
MEGISPIKSATLCSFADTLVTDGRDVGLVSIQMLSAPFRATGKDLLRAVGLGAAVALSSTLDRPIRNRTKDLDCSWADAVSDVGRFYQNKYVTFTAAGAFYGLGVVSGKPAFRRVGLEIIEAFEIAVIGTSLMKRLVGRDRPYVENGEYHFVGPHSGNDDHESFVSGDATKAFTLSAVLSAEAKSVPVTVVLYSLAMATSFQRLHTDQHWFSDTVGAAVWSTAVGLGVVYLNHHSAPALVRLSANPIDGSPMLALVFTFSSNKSL